MTCPDCDGPDPSLPETGNGVCSRCHGQLKDRSGSHCEDCGGSGRCMTCLGFGSLDDNP
jgi:hypothetical protein